MNNWVILIYLFVNVMHVKNNLFGLAVRQLIYLLPCPDAYEAK
jgi:hypothetical protein